MGSNFFKNLSYMSGGWFFKIIISFLATAIYVRLIGVSNYAVIGIVFSFNSLIHSFFELPFFLTLIKSRSYKTKDYNTLFEDSFLTVYLFIFFSNFFIITLLTPISFFFFPMVYDIPYISIYFVIAILALSLDRLNKFLSDFYRVNHNEVVVQRANSWNISLELLFSVFFIITFNLGVLGLFLGNLLSISVKNIILTFKMRDYVKFRFYFSFDLLKIFLKKIIIKEYLFNIIKKFRTSGIVFLSSFFLNSFHLGFLTIFTSIAFKLRELSGILWTHLSPLYSRLLNHKNYEDIKMLINSIFLSSVYFIPLSLSLLIIFGNKLLNIYLGYYSDFILVPFMIILLTEALTFPFTAFQSLVYVYDLDQLLNISMILLVFILITIFPFIHLFGLLGASLIYFSVDLIYSLLCWYYMDKKFCFIDPKTFASLLLSTILTSLCLLGFVSHMDLPIKELIIFFFIPSVLFLFFNLKSIYQSFIYLLRY